MGLQIEDGQGTGRSVGVNNDNFMKVSATSSTIEHHVNHHHGSAYTLSTSAIPAGADDCFFYMQNTSDTDMTVEGFYLAISAAGSVYAEINNPVTDITAGTGYTAKVPVNVNAGSGKTASGVFAVGTDLAVASGLTTGSEVGRGVIATTDASSWWNFNQDLILPKNKALTLWSSVGATVTLMLEFNYHDDELG